MWMQPHACEGVMAHTWTSHGTHMNESCHTCECNGTHVKKSRPIQMSHVADTNESVAHIWIDWFWLPICRTNRVRGLSNKEMKFQNRGAVPVQIAPLWISQPRNQSTPQSKSVYESCDMCKRIKSHIWMGAPLSHGWVISHTWMSHITYMNAMCQEYDGAITSHIRMSLVTIYIPMSHVTRMKFGTSHIWTHVMSYAWVMPQIWMGPLCTYESVMSLV